MRQRQPVERPRCGVVGAGALVCDLGIGHLGIHRSYDGTALHRLECTCAVCKPELSHAVGCLCEECSAAYERAWGPGV